MEIAGEKYAETHYLADNLSNVVLANGDIHEVRTDKYGNTEKKSVTYADGSCEHVTNEYDKETQRLSKITIDNSEQGEYNISYSYDSKGHVIEEVRGGENPLEKKFDYTTDGDMKESVYKVVKDASAEEDKDKYETLTYAYETDHTPDRRDANVELPYGISQQFAYDGLGRTRGITLGQVLAKDVYYQGFGDHTTNRVSSVWYGVNGIRKDNNKYTYDKAGNIATITENGLEAAKYVYDGLNRLVRENNSTMGKTYVVYDAAGNILYKTVNGRRIKYRYSQNGWKDQLISLTEGDQTYNFEYDVLGNPTLYKDIPMQWKGRRLTSYNGVNYAYDVNGIRTSKVRNGIEYKYIYDGNNLIAEQHIQGSNSEWIYYLYGVDGVAGFRYNDTTYLYRKNVQGDVTHIYTESGEQVAHYAYDAWGNVQILQERYEIATINPFRYRSYYFDEESKFYYLQTRYYDPALGRFISADSIEYLDPETLGGLNLYAYCGNNPIGFTDPEGTSFLVTLLICALIGAAAGGAFNGVVAYQQGKRGNELLGSIVGGAIMGAAMGAVLCLGGAAGVTSIGMSVAGYSLKIGAAFALSAAIGFAGGAASYAAENWISGKEVTLEGAFNAGAIGILQGALTFGMGFIGGQLGMFPGRFNITNLNYMEHILSTTGSISWIQAGVYGLQSLIGNALTKTALVAIPAAIIRKLIDWIFEIGGSLFDYQKR